MLVPFVGGSNPARSVNSSTQETVNWIPEQDEQAKFPIRLLPRPGLKTFSNAGSSPMRGQIEYGGAIYSVIGDTVWKFTTAGVASVVGTIGTTTGTVSLAKGTTQFMVVDGAKGYYSDGATVTEITDSDFPVARQVVWLDGYFIVDDADNAGRCWRSGANDASSWGALNFATAERNPDDVVSLAVKQRELWIVGENTTEPWYNAGGAGFTFQPMSGAFTEIGALARFATKAEGGFVFWLGRAEVGQGVVFQALGLQGQRISTPAIEAAINSGTGSLSDATADVIYIEGHLIYLLHIPGGKTLAYDQQTRLWHEWKTRGRDDFRGRHAVFLGGTTYFGDAEDGNLFELDRTTYTDNGLKIERIRRDRHIFDPTMRRLVRHKTLEVEFEAGVGNASVNDPMAMLQYSDDGGHTFSNELWRAVGKVGKYKNRCLWHNLGSSRDRVYEIRITDPVKPVLLAGYLDVL